MLGECFYKSKGINDEIKNYKNSCTYWRILHIGSHPNDYTFNREECKFETKEQAGSFLLALRDMIDKNPLTTDMRQYFEEEVNRNREKKKNLINELFYLDRHRSWLQTFAAKYNLKTEFEGNIRKELLELKKFMDEENDLLYNKMGKDFARTLRTLVANVVAIVDPDIAKEL